MQKQRRRLLIKNKVQQKPRKMLMQKQRRRLLMKNNVQQKPRRMLMQKQRRKLLMKKQRAAEAKKDADAEVAQKDVDEKTTYSRSQGGC